MTRMSQLFGINTTILNGEPVSLRVVSAQVEAAKTDLTKMIRYLTQATSVTVQTIALEAQEHRKRVTENNQVDGAAYKFLLRNVNYWASLGGFIDA